MTGFDDRYVDSAHGARIKKGTRTEAQPNVIKDQQTERQIGIAENRSDIRVENLVDRPRQKVVKEITEYDDHNDR